MYMYVKEKDEAINGSWFQVPLSKGDLSNRHIVLRTVTNFHRVLNLQSRGLH